MDNNFVHWLASQQTHQTRTIRIDTPKATFAADVGVPLSQGAAVGLAVAVAVTSLLWLLGCTWTAAWHWGAGLGVLAAAGCVVLFVLQHHALQVEPVRLAWSYFAAAHERKPTPPTPKRDWLVVHPRRAAPAGATLEHVIPELDADPRGDPDGQVKELYDFAVACWRARDVTRDGARRLGFGRGAWEALVGGQRGKHGESGRGVLDRAGCVYQDARGAWRIRLPLSAVLATNAELRAYAARRRDAGTGTGRDTHGIPLLGKVHTERGGQ